MPPAQTEIRRLHQMLGRVDVGTYLGGTTAYFPYVPSPIPIEVTVDHQQGATAGRGLVGGCRVRGSAGCNAACTAGGMAGRGTVLQGIAEEARCADAADCLTLQLLPLAGCSGSLCSR